MAAIYVCSVPSANLIAAMGRSYRRGNGPDLELL